MAHAKDLSKKDLLKDMLKFFGVFIGLETVAFFSHSLGNYLRLDSGSYKDALSQVASDWFNPDALRYNAGACTGLLLIFSIGVYVARYAKNPQIEQQQSYPTERSNFASIK